MSGRSIKRSVLYSALIFSAGCVTLNINIDFPEAKVEQAAEKIESEVRSGGDAAPPAEGASLRPASPRTGMRLGMPARVSLGAAIAQAAEPDLNIETPEIRELVEKRKKRWPEIDKLLELGYVGEALDGTLKEVDAKALPLKDAAKARQTVRAENDDRRNLYRHIAEANNLAAEDVPNIARKFAEVNQSKLKPGQYYERRDEEGKVQWTKK